MKNTFLTVFLLLTFFSYAQSISKSVIGMAGKTQSNGGLSVSWTAGEPVVGLMTSSSAQLGNGYYPSLDVQALLKEDFTMDIAIKIYPNPTSNFLYAEQKDQHQLRINIVDVNGRIVLENNINSGGQIDISNFSIGIYIIQVQDLETQKKNTYKIIKK
jgi:hypothetical protein